MAYVLCYYFIIQDFIINVIIVYTILMKLAGPTSGLDLFHVCSSIVIPSMQEKSNYHEC